MDQRSPHWNQVFSHYSFCSIKCLRSLLILLLIWKISALSSKGAHSTAPDGSRSAPSSWRFLAVFFSQSIQTFTDSPQFLQCILRPLECFLVITFQMVTDILPLWKKKVELFIPFLTNHYSLFKNHIYTEAMSESFFLLLYFGWGNNCNSLNNCQ